MRLYNKKDVNSALEKEIKKEVNILDKALKLAQGRELIGQVISVWFDHIAGIVERNIEKGNITQEDGITFLRFMEADSRRSVKKDRDKIVYGAIIAAIAMNPSEEDTDNELVQHYAQLIGVDIPAVKKILEKSSGKFRYYYALKCIAKSLPDEVKIIVEKLRFAYTTNDLFSRLRNRRYRQIHNNLETWINRFKTAVKEYKNNVEVGI